MSQQETEAAALTVMRGGDETILLVEDDAHLRASMCKSLVRLGYRVLEAVDRVEAVEVWKQHRDQIHLLLTDLVMPGEINGMELAEGFLKENPKLKVIYASGYSTGVADKDYRLKEGINYLSKPFETHKLAQTIRNILDQ